MSKNENTFPVGHLTVEIAPDSDAQSPSEWGDTELFLVANHRQCYIPEPGEKRITCGGQDLVDKYRGTHWVFGLEAYIHGGVRLALAGCGEFPDRQWDVSQLGFVFVSNTDWKTSIEARAAALLHIEEWNTFLSGEVYGYIVKDDEGNHLDSCWGMYGFDYCKEQGMEAAQRMVESSLSTACEI